MSKLTVYDKTGAAAGEFEFADELLVLDKGDQAVHDQVVAIQAARRRGTASTLQKGEVAGSNRKPWRQKGTGRARAGYRQSPVWRGGSVVFGPRPRSYAVKVNRKVARLAFRRCFSEKIAAGAVHVVDSLEVTEPKTKVMADLFKSIGVSGRVLLVVDRVEPNLALSVRNLPRVTLGQAGDLNVVEIMQSAAIVVTRSAMDKVIGRFGGGDGGAA